MWLLLSALIGCSPASAGGAPPAPDLLVAPQIPLVAAGAASGALTRGEVQQLQLVVQRIARLRSRALRDGVIDELEAAAIQSAESDFVLHFEALLRNRHVRAVEGRGASG